MRPDIDLIGISLAGILVLLIGYSLYKANKNPNVSFNLLDLLMENGRVSKVSCMVLGAFVSTTWAFIYDVLHRKGLDAAVLGAYGLLWIAPLLTRIMGGTAPTIPTDPEKK